MKRNRSEINPQSSQNPSNPSAGSMGTAGVMAGGTGPTVSQLEHYLDYTVVDRDDNRIGTMDAIWEDHTGQPAYLGVKTGWLGLGRTHVIPVYSADVSENTRKIRLPYTIDVVKNAPAFEEQSDIDDYGEEQIATYYRQYGFEDRARSWAKAGESPVGDTTRSDTTLRRESDEIRMPVSEERVEIGKREVEAGGVRLRKIIRTETVNQPVELKREELVVERVPAKDRQPTRTDKAFREEEIYVPLRREEPTVNRYTETKEDVKVSKKHNVEHRDVSETVRREDVEVERSDQGGKTRDDRPL